MFSADRPESQLALARLYRQQGLIAQAESAFQQALVLQPKFVPAYVNYANFLQQQNKEPGAFAILQQGLNEIEDAAIYHSLGLWYVRNKDKDKGIALLQKAAEMEPVNARYQYVYAIAIGEKKPQAAIKVLQSTLKNHTGNMEVLMALVSYYQQIGDEANALKYHQQSQRVMQTLN